MKSCLHIIAPVFGMIVLAFAPGVRAGGFETSVLPLLESKCPVCHAGATPQAELNLESLASIVAGGKSGPAVFPGSPETNTTSVP